MAYDPEARETGNSAMIIGIVALVLLAGAALAWYSSRPRDADVVVATPPVIERSTTVVNNAAPAPASPSTVVVSPPASPSTVVVRQPGTHTTTRIEKNTTSKEKVVVPSGSAGTSRNGSSGSSRNTSNNTNVTVNVPPPPGSPGSAGATPAAGMADNSAATDNAASNTATDTTKPGGY